MGYSFIYAFFYQLFEKLRSSDSKFQATIFTMVAIFFHMMFLLAAFKLLTNDYIGRTFGHPSNKYVFVPVVVVLIWVMERILKKNSDSMVKKYENANLLSLSNTLIIVVATIIPLIISIFLLKKN